MTLEEVEKKLPNGLHDARIRTLAIDYEHGEIRMKLDVLVGLPDEPAPQRDRYEAGELIFKGMPLCAIEPPSPTSSFRQTGPVWFSYEKMEQSAIPDALAQVIPPGVQCYSFFVEDWLSHIYIAAQDVAFSWD